MKGIRYPTKIWYRYPKITIFDRQVHLPSYHFWYPFVKCLRCKSWKKLLPKMVDVLFETCGLSESKPITHMRRMCGIFTYIWLKSTEIVGRYTMHGCMGLVTEIFEDARNSIEHISWIFLASKTFHYKDAIIFHKRSVKWPIAREHIVNAKIDLFRDFPS